MNSGSRVSVGFAEMQSMNRKRDGKERRDDRSRDRKDSRRDLTSSSAATDKASRLRMDSYSDRNRRPSPPRRREMDNVMKKARRDGTDKSQYWNKKLLEVEEKDPNRWRHSGYKELYGERSSSQSKSRSRSPKPKATKNSGRVRSPVPSASRNRKSRSRSPVRKPTRVQKRPSPSLKTRKSPHKRARSPSGSSDSGSSCSDDSCSVCSPKPTKRKPRSRSGSETRRKAPVKLGKPASGPGSKSSATIGRKPPVKPSLSTKKPEKGSPPRDPRTSTSKPRKDQEKTSPTKRTKMLAAVKIEGQKKAVPQQESDSEDSSSSSEASATETPKMTLSERFGKMAQWSVDRRDVDYMKNMTITKESNSTAFKVVIDGPDEEESYRPSAAPEFADRRTGAGYYPETMHEAPYGLPSWDDIHVRYKYYKSQGYLRDLTLEDYIKWEEWWYKYQKWRDTERYYEQWAMSSRPHKSRRYRNKQNP